MRFEKLRSQLQNDTPRPRAALLMCLKKYSATGNSTIGNYYTKNSAIRG